MARIRPGGRTQVRRGRRQEIGCITVAFKYVPFLTCEPKCKDHGGPALVFYGVDGPAAAGAQVCLAVEEEEYDFAGARSKFEQCIPTFHAAVGLNPSGQAPVNRHGPGHGH